MLKKFKQVIEKSKKILLLLFYFDFLVDNN